jgi:hypothetical protein
MYGSVSYIVRRPPDTRSPGKGTDMTHRTPTLTPRRRAGATQGVTTIPPTSPSSPAGDLDNDPRPTRGIALVAGVAVLVLAALSAVAILVVVDGLVITGDAARTATDIMASEGTFRLAVAGLYFVVVLDIVAAWALFQFFAPVDSWLARLAAWLRVAFAVVFLVAISQLAAVPGMLSDAGYRDAFGQQQLQAQAMVKLEAFDHTWMAALLLFGAHLALLGYLAYRSGYVPRLIGVLLVISGAGYAFDTFSSVLSADPVVVTTFTFLGEFLLAVWLVVRGGRVQKEAHHEV